MFALGLALQFLGMLACLGVFVLVALDLVPPWLTGGPVNPWQDSFAFRHFLPLIVPIFLQMFAAVAQGARRRRDARRARNYMRIALISMTAVVIYTVAVRSYALALAQLIILAATIILARIPTLPPEPVRDKINLYR